MPPATMAQPEALPRMRRNLINASSAALIFSILIVCKMGSNRIVLSEVKAGVEPSVSTLKAVIGNLEQENVHKQEKLERALSNLSNLKAKYDALTSKQLHGSHQKEREIFADLESKDQQKISELQARLKQAEGHNLRKAMPKWEKLQLKAAVELNHIRTDEKVQLLQTRQISQQHAEAVLSDQKRMDAKALRREVRSVILSSPDTVSTLLRHTSLCLKRNYSCFRVFAVVYLTSRDFF